MATARNRKFSIFNSPLVTRTVRAALLISVASLSIVTAQALTNNLALTPPMGWNDWNTFGCGTSEAVVQQTADAMATNGMKAAGYQFINVDDCWASGRDSNGVVVVNASKFPSGIKALADYVHPKGLKFGLYTDHGTNTCSSSNPPGSYGYGIHQCGVAVVAVDAAGHKFLRWHRPLRLH